MNNSSIKQLLKDKFINKSNVNIKLGSSISFDTTKDDEDKNPSVSVGLGSLVKASKKLLDINRGILEPDERDSLKFKNILNVDDLMEERIKLDAGKLKNILMFKLAKQRHLKNMQSGYFDSYASGHIVGNSLSSPSEEINPIMILEQSNRITQMGVGGIGSEEAITREAQNVHPSQFGFIDTISSPESIRSGIDVRLSNNTRLSTNNELLTRVIDKKTGKKVWLTPQELENSIVAFPD